MAWRSTFFAPVSVLAAVRSTPHAVSMQYTVSMVKECGRCHVFKNHAQFSGTRQAQLTMHETYAARAIFLSNTFLRPPQCSKRLVRGYCDLQTAFRPTTQRTQHWQCFSVVDADLDMLLLVRNDLVLLLAL